MHFYAEFVSRVPYAVVVSSLNEVWQCFEIIVSIDGTNIIDGLSQYVLQSTLIMPIDFPTIQIQIS